MHVLQTLEMQELSDHFQVIKRLGQGTYGKVLLAHDKKTGEPMAIKLVRKDRTKLKAFLKELSMSVSLSNNHGIIKTYPVFIYTMDYYVMAQELAPAGTLHHLIKAKVGIPEDAVKRCAMQLSRALDYMHGRGLVHLDLKPDNVLLMDNDCYHIKLCDFGLTKNVGSLVSSLSHIIPFMSPELCDLKQDEYLILNPIIDSWALGVLLFIALIGHFPWNAALEGDIRYKVYINWQKNEDLIPPPGYWENFTKDALNMFNKIFSHDCAARPSILSVLNYLNVPWKVENLSNDGMEVVEEQVDVMTEIVEDSQEFVIEQDQEGNTTTPYGRDLCNPALVVLEETTTLTLGSEVEIP
ncbi:serine/threonine-protein kinase SBK1-like [Mixophyes fleayi]|uniref:serine/threonine-protein kinase SBK1-like n=1 Tax=Mixophyes fleayi TaxID=3061075 RepID=UPI003F4DD0DF